MFGVRFLDVLTGISPILLGLTIAMLIAVLLLTNPSSGSRA